MIKIDKIALHNFRFFIDEEENNTFYPNAKGMLVYGENGSGKSSLYKAFEFLTKPTIAEEEFAKSINIFKQDDAYLDFEFDNNETLKIDGDHLSLGSDYDFIKTLSVSKPIIDYKLLLKVSYSIEQEEKKNLYKFFENILSEYPISGNKILKNLKEEEDESYFSVFEKILKDELFDEINIFLGKFKQNFTLTEINFNFGFHKVNLEVEYFDKKVEEYQNFLNEARLSALAMSIYFAIIKKQFDKLEENSLKVLVLDDILISLDMSNRLNLLEILKSEFSDFQIFFFTHDKALFEIFKDKMSWRAYEIYVDKSEEGFEIPFVKKSNSFIEQAKYQKQQKNYDCSANLLRQYTEKLLCKFLPVDKLVNKNCKQLDLNGLLQNAVAFENSNEEKNQSIIDILESLKTYRTTVLNPASHYDDVNVYKSELNDIILILNNFESEIP
ncbi:MAG: recombinase RecF [Campylobacterota bacterium]|nr:recombinase RecF [Campylobacterota bacterium]